jgi:glycosyltransferase involved in cell wall biosynthesis
LDSARAKALGLRVLIDGSVLGPKEMGTQSLIVNLSTALADRQEIQYLVLAAPDPANLPEYARALGRHPKVRMIQSGNLDFPDSPFVDIIHRPFQPTGPIPWTRWRSLSKRSVITVQDLVAYRNGAYFPNFDEWDRYRDNFNRQIALCDAVVSISHDVVTSIEEELMPIDGDRVFVIENGIDARSREEAKRVPDALLRCGWAASSYLLVLGATYAHKNRDLAIRTWIRLREMGLKQKLVLVGPSVPHGSSRADEAMLMRDALASEILVLPEVSSEERNWLLSHTALLIYVTSAEGFGLVPFEAASLGAATLYVSFGPLRELIADPEAPRTYDVELLARRAYALIVDPAVSQSAINAVLKDLDRLSWQETARKSIQAYYSVLDRPSRVFES